MDDEPIDQKEVVEPKKKKTKELAPIDQKINQDVGGSQEKEEKGAGAG